MSEDKRAARRAAMPQITAMVESLERDGLEPRVIFASENGITLGQLPQYREVFEIPHGYCKAASTTKTGGRA